MLQFWVDFLGNLMRKDDSSSVAAGRLKGTVFLDRLSLSPATLDLIRNDVVRSISRYLVIDESTMTLAVQAEGRSVALAASIPVLRPRDVVLPLPEEAAPRVVDSEAAAERGNPGVTTAYDRARARALRRKRQPRRF
jgi:cell division topological specificity factor